MPGEPAQALRVSDFIGDGLGPVALWHEIIGDPTIADAIMDRIAFKSHRIELNGESVRKKMYSID